MSGKDVIYRQTGVVVRNRRRVTYYRFDRITSASKLRLWRLAVTIRPPAKKRRRGSGGSRQGSKRQMSATSVLARLTGEATSELVTRTNEVTQ